jgi:hypothetical protein
MGVGNQIHVNGKHYTSIQNFLTETNITNRQYYKHLDFSLGDDRYNIAAAKSLGLKLTSKPKKRKVEVKIWGMKFKSFDEACSHFGVDSTRAKGTRTIKPERIIEQLLGMTKKQYFKHVTKIKLLDNFLYKFKILGHEK